MLDDTDAYFLFLTDADKMQGWYSVRALDYRFDANITWKISFERCLLFYECKVCLFVLQSALCVDVAGGTETSLTITFMPYECGDAPVRVENLCEDVFFKLHQK